MIKKIIKIKNVGKFESYSSSGDVDFRKMNIIYSENGQGKTTLSAILRSLRKGEDDLIMGRKRLGASADPEVQINFEGNGNISFNNKRWDKQYEHLEIFDSQFVSENICSGYYVDQ